MNGRSFVSGVLCVIGLSACATTPDLTNDPRGGGLLGGIMGIYRGDYEQRIKQVQDGLMTVTQEQEQLKKEASVLEDARRLRLEEVGKQQRELDELAEQTKKLSVRINNIEGAMGINERRAREPRAKVAKLDTDIRITKNDMDKARLTYNQLEERREKLRHEYSHLIELLTSE